MKYVKGVVFTVRDMPENKYNFVVPGNGQYIQSKKERKKIRYFVFQNKCNQISQRALLAVIAQYLKIRELNTVTASVPASNSTQK